MCILSGFAGSRLRRSCTLILLAWIMWMHTEGPQTDSWTQLTGFATERQCQDSVADKLATWKHFNDAKFSGTSVAFSENKMSLTYLCLAENEDPRKTKPRNPGRVK